MNLISIPMLSDLMIDPDKVSLLPPEAIPVLRGELARLDSLLLARLFAGSNGKADRPDGDRRLGVEEAASKLGTSKVGFTGTLRTCHSPFA